MHLFRMKGLLPYFLCLLLFCLFPTVALAETPSLLTETLVYDLANPLDDPTLADPARLDQVWYTDPVWTPVSGDYAPGMHSAIQLNLTSMDPGDYSLLLATKAIQIDPASMPNAAVSFWIKDTAAQPSQIVYAGGLEGTSVFYLPVSITGSGQWQKYSLDLSQSSPQVTDFSPLLLGIRGYHRAASQPLISGFQIENMALPPVTLQMAADELSVTLHHSAADAVIHYTTDGTAPTTASPVYNPSQPIWAKNSQTTYVFAFAQTSQGASAISTFYLQAEDAKLVPTASAQGTVRPNTQVSLFPPAEGFRIFYTDDGSDPKVTVQNGVPTGLGSTKSYTDPITITQPIQLRAVAAKGGYCSQAVTFSYSLDTAVDPYDQGNGNDSFAQATSLSFPFALDDANIHNSSDVDYYYITIPQGQVQLLLEQDNASYGLELYDQNQQLVQASQLAQSNQAISCKLAAGGYYLKVFGKDGSCSATPYLLRGNLTAPRSLNLSELHMANFCFSQDSPFRYSDMGINSGGHYMMSTNYLSSWQGPVSESVCPYPLQFDTREENPYFPYQSYEPDYTLTRAIFLPNAGAFATAAEFRNTLKAAVYCYGAASVSYRSSKASAAGSEGQYIYDPYTKATNHAVTLVGWDDDFPKELFTYQALDQQGAPVGDPLHPNQNGAWIIRNSWGAEYNDGGYIYISYEDISFCAINLPAISILEPCATLGCNRMYQHDETGWSSSCTALGEDENTYTGNVGYFKNTFTCKSQETLTAVSLGLYAADTRYEIYVSVADGQPERKAEGFLSNAGYYTIAIGQTPLAAGQEFSLIVRLESQPGAMPQLFCEQTNTADATVNNIQYPDAKLDCAAAVFHEGESFVSLDGQDWLDLNDPAAPHGQNLAIRGYTVAEEVSSQDVVYSKTPEETPACAIPQNPQNPQIEIPITGSLLEDPSNTQDSSMLTPSQPQLLANGAPAGVREISLSMSENAVSQTEMYDPEKLPSSFDLRDLDVASYVKNQGYFGTCWSFAAIASAELTYMRRNSSAQQDPLVTLEQAQATLEISPLAQQPTYYATPTVTPAEYGYDVIRWNYSGDLDSITIHTLQSRSGQTTKLFTATAPGTITVTASIGGDPAKGATTTIHINLEGVGFSFDGPNALQLLGVNEAMEYSLDGGASWIACTAGMSLEDRLAQIGSHYGIQVRYQSADPAKPNNPQTIAIYENDTKGPRPVVLERGTHFIALAQNDACEYAMDGGEWQSSGTFRGLAANSSHSFTVRLRARGTTLPGPAGSALSVKTKAESDRQKEDTPTPENPTILPFGDIHSSDWSYDPVTYVWQNGLMTGVDSSHFLPDGTMTRAMVATVLWRMENCPTVNGGSPFLDVTDPSSWYYTPVLWASQQGIVQGYNGGWFTPNAPITREQLATLLYRYLQTKGGGFQDNWFFRLEYGDAASISPWAYEAMCWMSMNQVLQGADGKILPAANAKRSEVAAMLQRYLLL